MKKIILFILFFSLQFVLFAQNMDTTYVGADTTLASYKLGRKIGAWFPFVMLVIIALLFIRSAYRFGGKDKNID